MKVDVMRSIEDLIQLQDAWNELASVADARPSGYPFWIFSALQDVGWRPTAIAVEDDGQLVGLGLFQVIRPWGVPLLRFLGPRWAPSAPLVAAGRLDVAARLWQVLNEEVPASLDLYGFDASHGNVGLATSSGTSHVRVVSWRATHEVAALAGAGGSSKENVEIIRTPERVSEVMPILTALAAESVDDRNALPGPEAVFTRTVLHQGAAAGRLRLFLGDGGAEVWFAGADCLQRVARWGSGARNLWDPQEALARAADEAKEAGLSTLDLTDVPYPGEPSNAGVGRYATLNVRVATSHPGLALASGVIRLRDSIVREGR
jgi:hypothetical protein